MNVLGAMEMPKNFKYGDVFLKGKPRHERYDRFRLRHPSMEIGHRAKIFSPFDALRGFGEALSSKDILYEARAQQEPEEREELDRRLKILQRLTRNRRAARENRVTVAVTYFAPCDDEENDAYGIRGQYKTVTGICWGVDTETLCEITVGNLKISLEDIRKIENAEGIFKKANGELWE